MIKITGFAAAPCSTGPVIFVLSTGRFRRGLFPKASKHQVVSVMSIIQRTIHPADRCRRSARDFRNIHIGPVIPEHMRHFKPLRQCLQLIYCTYVFKKTITLLPIISSPFLLLAAAESGREKFCAGFLCLLYLLQIFCRNISGITLAIQ